MADLNAGTTAPADVIASATPVATVETSTPATPVTPAKSGGSRWWIWASLFAAAVVILVLGYQQPQMPDYFPISAGYQHVDSSVVEAAPAPAPFVVPEPTPVTVEIEEVAPEAATPASVDSTPVEVPQG